MILFKIFKIFPAIYLADSGKFQIHMINRMVTKVRLGHLMVLATVGRMLHWPPTRARCMLCGDGTETVQHFVMRLTRGALLNCILARPDAVEAVNEMEGLVDWLVDKVIKNCLDMMWRIPGRRLCVS